MRNTPDVPADRRRSQRRSLLDEHGITGVRIRPGCNASLVDVSSGGALVETTHRLMPGTSIDVQLHVRSRRVLVRCRVLRSEISKLGPSGPTYRGALNFDRMLSWLVAGAPLGYVVPTTDNGGFFDERGDATPQRHPRPSAGDGRPVFPERSRAHPAGINLGLSDRDTARIHRT